MKSTDNNKVKIPYQNQISTEGDFKREVLNTQMKNRIAKL